MKIILTCSRNHPGVREHLIQLKKAVLPQAVFTPIEDLVSVFPDPEKFSFKIPGYKRVFRKVKKVMISNSFNNYGDNIILGSWWQYYPEIIENLNKRGIHPSILWCSTIGQSEMTWMIEVRPIIKILDLLKKRKIKYLLVPEKTYESLSHIDNVMYLPHPVDIRVDFTNIEKKMEGKNVDLFLKARPGKNVLQQMIAQKYSELDYTLHTNVNTEEIINLARKLKLSFEHYSWLPENDYYSLIQNMDVSLQVTWTESFNYAVCERMLLGVPVLVSPEIFLINEDTFLSKFMIVKTPDSPKAIASKLDLLLDNENQNLREEIIRRQKERVKEIAKRYNGEVKETIGKLFT